MTCISGRYRPKLLWGFGMIGAEGVAVVAGKNEVGSKFPRRQ